MEVCWMLYDRYEHEQYEWYAGIQISNLIHWNDFGVDFAIDGKNRKWCVEEGAREMNGKRMQIKPMTRDRVHAAAYQLHLRLAGK